jgi:hypothetical protein
MGTSLASFHVLSIPVKSTGRVSLRSYAVIMRKSTLNSSFEIPGGRPGGRDVSSA